MPPPHEIVASSEIPDDIRITEDWVLFMSQSSGYVGIWEEDDDKFWKDFMEWRVRQDRTREPSFFEVASSFYNSDLPGVEEMRSILPFLTIFPLTLLVLKSLRLYFHKKLEYWHILLAGLTLPGGYFGSSLYKNYQNVRNMYWGLVDYEYLQNELPLFQKIKKSTVFLFQIQPILASHITQIGLLIREYYNWRLTPDISVGFKELYKDSDPRFHQLLQEHEERMRRKAEGFDVPEHDR